MTREHAATLIGERFGDAQVEGEHPLVVTLPVGGWVSFAQFAKDTLGCRFFAFSTAVDWKEQGLEVVARVDNLDDRVAVLMKTRLGAGVSECPSLTPVYRGADWMERECYDLFGIRFDGHPDLRRILLSDDWEGHPLLKSYAVDTPHPPYR
ncbi:MAG: NADH-quinone oxidoreductase subunit C [Acidobacteria bacterium]|nr:NADH-quinone oxidoreductase subunit C [Acidobacteriota bacterium]